MSRLAFIGHRSLASTHNGDLTSCPRESADSFVGGILFKTYQRRSPD
ncbi:hypothetical protein THL1_566 [Pseudomonas sp. TCU-HL1]|nr:hypothetical protein THL1_566 [Pseudomonas sp. TCU-HL1]